MSASASARAQVSGGAKTLAAGGGQLTAVASAVALAQTCWLNGGGEAAAAAIGEGHPLKIIRMRVAGQSVGKAFAKAEAQSWVLGYPLPAYGRAVLFGTTYEVGWGEAAIVAATLVGVAERIRRFDGTAVGAAAAAGSGSTLAAGAATAKGEAKPIAEPRLTRGGVNYYDAFGVADCTAGALSAAPPRVSPTLQIQATARATGVAQAVKFAGGVARCGSAAANLVANLIPTTGVAGATLAAAITVTAKVTAYARGFGSLTAKAAPAAAVTRLTVNAGVTIGAAISHAEATRVVLGAGSAMCRADCALALLRTAYAAGTASLAVAIQTGGLQLNPLAPSLHRVEVDALNRMLEVEANDYSVTVDAPDNFMEAA